MNPEPINAYLDYYTGWLGAPAGTLAALARIESNYNPVTGNFLNVCNSVNACGLMQLRPDMLSDIRRVYGMNVDPLEPVHAVVAAAAAFTLNYLYLSRANVQRITWAALVVAYNGGWTAGRYYATNGQAPSSEGRNYVAKWANFTGVA